MTACMRGFAGLIALMSLAGCATAQPTAPQPAMSRLTTQALGTPREILIKFRTHPDDQAVATFGSEYGLRPKDVIREIDVHVMTVLGGEDATVIVTRVERSPMVDYAEPNYRLSIK